MPLIRTTIDPDREVEVDERELLDLQRQGLVVPELTPAAPAPADPPRKPKPTTDADKGA